MNKYSHLLLLPFLLFSCQKKDEDKIPLFTSDATKETIKGNDEYLVNKLYENDFDYMIEKKMSFPLFVYAAGCGACDNFSIVLKDYIRINKVIFPYMTLSVFNLSKTDTPSLSDSALLFYKEGKLIKTYDDILSQVFSTGDLVKIMDQYTYSSNVSYLSTSYTYSNSSVPFYSYHFSSSILIEESEDTPHDHFSIKDGNMLLLSSDSFSYPSLYQKIKDDEYVSIINITKDIKDNKKEEVEKKIGSSALYPYQKITYKNGLCTATESVDL